MKGLRLFGHMFTTGRQVLLRGVARRLCPHGWQPNYIGYGATWRV